MAIKANQTDRKFLDTGASLQMVFWIRFMQGLWWAMMRHLQAECRKQRQNRHRRIESSTRGPQSGYLVWELFLLHIPESAQRSAGTNFRSWWEPDLSPQWKLLQELLSPFQWVASLSCPVPQFSHCCEGQNCPGHSPFSRRLRTHRNTGRVSKTQAIWSNASSSPSARPGVWRGYMLCHFFFFLSRLFEIVMTDFIRLQTCKLSLLFWWKGKGEERLVYQLLVRSSLI